LQVLDAKLADLPSHGDQDESYNPEVPLDFLLPVCPLLLLFHAPLRAGLNGGLSWQELDIQDCGYVHAGLTALDEEQSRQQSVRNGDDEEMEIYVGPDHSASYDDDDVDEE
jgi:hypothetical protein